ncbi:MAG TPA: ABC transporter permease [Dehalococcoidia bacterium]
MESIQHHDVAAPLGGRLDQPAWRTWLRGLARFVRRKPLGAFGGFVVAVMLLTAVLADVIAPYGYNDQVLADRMQPPSAAHPFGTDHVGRDLLSRVIYGTRVSVVIGFSAIFLSMAVATALGTVSGYYGGKLDTILQRLVDVWLAFPALILLLTAVSILSPRGSPMERGLAIVISLALILGISSSRVIRGAVIGIKHNQYVEAARTLGASDLRIVFRYIIPNIFAVIIVLATVQLGVAILAEASISFLGYGIPDPFPAWGQMLNSQGIGYMRAAWWLAFWPGLAIALVVFAFNMLGDALRDVLDPRLRGGR